MKATEKLALRPHHLLCLGRFVGNGYSAAFTAHMTEVLETLRSTPNQSITLTAGCDTLCSVCPNRQANACKDKEKVKALDDGVLAYLQAKPGDQDTWRALGETMRTMPEARFLAICEHCQWLLLCRTLPRNYGGEYESDNT